MATPSEGTVGWRFIPTDEELVNYFLRKKINGKDEDVKIIREIDVCKWEPWDLPGQSELKSDDNEWFFFCRRNQKFLSSSRLNRATGKGYWKATGKDRKIKSKSKKNEIGMKKTLVFHTGRAPKGKRTCWVVHEYQTTLKELDGTHPGQTPYVLCRLFKKDDDSLSSATDNDVKLASLSPIPIELSPIELKPELVSRHVGSFAEQECDKAPVSSENYKDESSNTTSQEREPDVNLDYSKLFGDPDPYDLSLLESPTMESMGSSLPPHPTADSFCINADLQFNCFNNEHDDYTSQVRQPILTDSLDHYGNHDNNWISSFDFEIPEHELINQYQVLPGADSELFLNTSSENTEVSQLVADLEQQYSSNVESSGPVPATDVTWTSSQELGNLQTRPEYQGGAFLSGSGLEHCVVPNNISSSANYDHAADTGIQVRRRQPRATQHISKFNKQGTAQRRIHLQTNLGKSLISTESGSGTEVSSELTESKDTKRIITKKFISSLFSSFKPSSLTVSHKFIFGLASVLTIVVVYAGIHVCRA